ncbi:MAG: hypothetical protein Q4E24_13385 [bacterium]|nr:hypothetical protein [bacterium]
MITGILDAVTRRLSEIFDDKYAIYTDEVKQGLEEPCFFVMFLEPSEKPMIGQRYFLQNGMVIQFIPDESEQVSKDVYEVAEVLMDGMEYITLSDGDLLRGTGRRWQVVDGVLHFFVSYNLFVRRKEGQQEPMEEIEVNRSNDGYGREKNG